MVESSKILIVDDDPGIRLALRDFLTQNGFTDVTAAANGFEALEWLRSSVPRLIISDITMPQMDGYAFVQQLRNDTRLKSIHVIVLTGRSEMAELFKMAEIYNFLIKPVEPQALLEMVNRVLGKGEQVPGQDAENFLNKIEKMEDVLAKKVQKISSLKESFEQIKRIIKKKRS